VGKGVFSHHEKKRVREQEGREAERSEVPHHGEQTVPERGEREQRGKGEREEKGRRKEGGGGRGG